MHLGRAQAPTASACRCSTALHWHADMQSCMLEASWSPFIGCMRPASRCCCLVMFLYICFRNIASIPETTFSQHLAKLMSRCNLAPAIFARIFQHSSSLWQRSCPTANESSCQGALHCSTMRFGSTTKVLAKRMPKHAESAGVSLPQSPMSGNEPVRRLQQSRQLLPASSSMLQRRHYMIDLSSCLCAVKASIQCRNASCSLPIK